MNFIITKIQSTNEYTVTWRIHPSGNFYKTIVILKQHDLKDLLIQIIDQSPSTVNFLKTLLK